MVCRFRLDGRDVIQHRGARATLSALGGTERADIAMGECPAMRAGVQTSQPASPKAICTKRMVNQAGLEPATLCLEGMNGGIVRSDADLYELVNARDSKLIDHACTSLARRVPATVSATDGAARGLPLRRTDGCIECSIRKRRFVR